MGSDNGGNGTSFAYSWLLSFLFKIMTLIVFLTVLARDNANSNPSSISHQRADSPPLPTVNAPVSEDDGEDEDDFADALPLFTRPRNSQTSHARQTSVVSMYTAGEMHEIIDLLGPTVDAPVDRPRHDRARSDDLAETFIDPLLHSPVSDDESENEVDIPQIISTMSSSGRSRKSYASYASSYSSYSQPSEYELVTSDGEIERVYLPPSPTYPGFHLPRSRASGISEAPSLSSSRSRSSFSSSSSGLLLPPTPGLASPAEYVDGHALPIIVERQNESQDWDLSSGSSESLSPSDTLVASWPKHKSTLQWKLPNKPPPKEIIIEEPRRPASPTPPSPADSQTSPLSPISPKTPISPYLLSPASPTASTFSSKKGSLSRLLKKDKLHPSDSTASLASQISQLPLDNKALKAEEKRRKKEEAKLRTERLAAELKSRAKQRSRAEADNASTISADRKKREPGAMYGGLGQAGLVL
ncbi:hypothetical protein GYMLUDRAFT_763085 [Collybiopsis luxurians FD-317 M1]|uniref:Uncharacterized protein n=1 Tax=Collybiopsis luxurians FD-317 M1 TaxID=944289 RepID=A0A0D0CPE4_9AGAR|nr:hypothetical protein GYMLUDRAFT_763085 [Collybiopsis luxurians FD-317 M1]